VIDEMFMHVFQSFRRGTINSQSIFLPPVVVGNKLIPAADADIHSAKAPNMGWFREYKSSDLQKDSHIVVALWLIIYSGVAIPVPAAFLKAIL